jgi:alpha-acetolactate decarboxylase
MNNVYQYSTLSALMQGLCEGGKTASQILSRGDHGLGTVPGMNGEVIIIDGEAYHYSSEKTRKLGDSDLFSFAMSTQFRPAWETFVPTVTFDSLSHRLFDFLPSKQNCFLSIRLDGFFNSITFRLIAAQDKAYETPLELIKRQRLSSYTRVRGTMFGFYSPTFASAFSAAGYHLHFISNDRTLGGHVTEFDASLTTISVSVVNEYNVELPQSAEFNEFPIQPPKEADVATVMTKF